MHHSSSVVVARICIRRLSSQTAAFFGRVCLYFKVTCDIPYWTLLKSRFEQYRAAAEIEVDTQGLGDLHELPISRTNDLYLRSIGLLLDSRLG